MWLFLVWAAELPGNNYWSPYNTYPSHQLLLCSTALMWSRTRKEWTISSTLMFPMTTPLGLTLICCHCEDLGLLSWVSATTSKGWIQFSPIHTSRDSSSMLPRKSVGLLLSLSCPQSWLLAFMQPGSALLCCPDEVHSHSPGCFSQQGEG